MAALDVGDLAAPRGLAWRLGRRHDGGRMGDTRRFLGLEPTDDPARWRLPVVNGICTIR